MDPASAFLYNSQTCGRAYYYSKNGVYDEGLKGRFANSFAWNEAHVEDWYLNEGSRWSKARSRDDNQGADAPLCMTHGNLQEYIQHAHPDNGHDVGRRSFIIQFWSRNVNPPENIITINCSNVLNHTGHGDIDAQGNTMINQCNPPNERNAVEDLDPVDEETTAGPTESIDETPHSTASSGQSSAQNDIYESVSNGSSTTYGGGNEGDSLETYSTSNGAYEETLDPSERHEPFPFAYANFSDETIVLAGVTVLFLFLMSVVMLRRRNSRGRSSVES